jgi:hypothetical protein
MFSITSEHVTPQLCPKLVQKFSEWLPEFASTLTGNRKQAVAIRKIRNSHATRKAAYDSEKSSPRHLRRKCNENSQLQKEC